MSLNLKSEVPQHSFSIYRSSAGSGKTYRLALEFVALAIKNPNLFNKILAVTFTNKATREMKERIISFLQKLAKSQDSGLLRDVQKEVGALSEEQISANSAIVIEKILHNYTQFSISTIDAFFQKIVKSFAKELGLMGNFNIELDQNEVLQEVIDQILDDLGKEKDLTDWLIDFSISKVDDNKAWNIRPEIESLAGEIIKENFSTVDAALQGKGKAEFNRLLSQTSQIKNDFETFMSSGAKKALRLIEKYDLTLADFAFGVSGPAGYFSRILKGVEYDPKARVRKALANPETWSSKTSKKREQINSVVDAGLQHITQTLVDHYEQRFPEFVTALEIQRNLYVFGILSKINDILRAYRQENDVMLISDVAVFLNSIIADNDAPFIYEKTGSWYRHYLIDEFQDTSANQWKNFLPLVENGLSQQYKSLLVGDGKQSIYRWRGGDWNLILQQVHHDLLNYAPQSINLDTNWRSDRKIVEFNNEVFAYLSRMISLDFITEIEGLTLPENVKDELKTMAGDVKKLYQDVTQKVAAKNLQNSSGFIGINVFQKTEGVSWKERVLDELPKNIEALQDIGFRASDIAILVRRSDEGKQVIEKLMRYKHSPDGNPKYCYDAISNESLFLGNSTAIRLIINTIKYGLNPTDTISRAEIRFNYHRLKTDASAPSPIRDISFIENTDVFPVQFEISIQRFLGLPVYEMVESIIQYFGIQDVKHKGYLQAFQDVVLDYFGSKVSDLNDFLEWWEDKGKRQSIQLPESMNAIRVMTIHKSKGLEFKALLIPFCDWKLDLEATKNNIIWCSTDKKPFNQAGILPLRYARSLENSYFASDYFKEKIRAYIDNLNLLYVALTRAENYLMLNCPPEGISVSNVGDLMLKAINHLRLQPNDQLPVVVNENENIVTRYYIGEPVISPSSTKIPDSTPEMLPYQSCGWNEKIAIRTQGSNFFDSETPDWKTRINYGLLMHEILASIKNQQEALPLLHRYYHDGIISASERDLLKDELNTIFSNPTVRGWFNTGSDVKTEAPILIKNGADKRPDRVLIQGKDVIVIDFKTGAENPAHNRQVQNYRSLLLEMGYENVQAWLLYISHNKVINVQ